MTVINKETQSKNLVKAVLKILKIMRWKTRRNFQKLTRETSITLVYFVNVIYMDKFLANLLNFVLRLNKQKKDSFSIFVVLDCCISKTRKII